MNNTKFSVMQEDAVKIGANYVKRLLNSEAPESYKSFKNTDNKFSVVDEGAMFNALLIDAAYEKSGLPKEHNDLKDAFRQENFRTAMFSVVEKVFDTINSRNELEEALTFAEVRSAAEGDSMLIDVKATNAYFFHKQARGITGGTLNAYYGTPVVLAPNVMEASVGFGRSQIVSGRVDWGREIARATRGLRSGYLSAVADVVYDIAANPIGNKITTSGTFNEADFRLKQQYMAARNGSSPNNTYAFGTSLALSYIMPDNPQFQYGLGSDYKDRGFFTTAFGVRAIEIQQALKPDQKSLIVPNNYVILLSADVQKPVIVGTSGESRVELSNQFQNAANKEIFTIKTDIDVKIGGQGIFVQYKMA